MLHPLNILRFLVLSMIQEACSGRASNRTRKHRFIYASGDGNNSSTYVDFGCFTGVSEEFSSLNGCLLAQSFRLRRSDTYQE